MAEPIDRSRRGVWITRAEPGASVTAGRVARLGLTPVVAPLLSFRSIEAELALGADEALAFTSLNGVARAAALTGRRSMPVFAVGDATAEAARAAGFSTIVSAAGDVRALAALIVRAGPPAVLHPCALETAGDLVGALRLAGVPARRLAVYETVQATRLPAPVEAAFQQGALAAILIHSPKAARTAAGLLRGRHGGLDGVAAIGLSPACLDPLRALALQALIAVPEPAEDALMQALGDFTGGRPHG